ncbi:translation elongation factor Ts [soil metagenome]
MAITAADVKKLRDATGAGMMDAKKALEAADGNFDQAVEELRIKGAGKAAKRGSERSTSNGLVAAAENAMILLACETDFVAKNEQFQTLAGDILAHFVKSDATDVASLLAETLADGKTVEENITGMNALIGEKLELRNAVKLEGKVATYLHKKSADLPQQVGVLVAFTGDDVNAARGAAMQVAALKAQYLTRDEVPAEVIETEKRVAEATAREEGKPEAALPRIVEGRVTGFYKGEGGVLLDQPAVQDSKKTVKALLDEAGVSLTAFARFDVGV